MQREHSQYIKYYLNRRVAQRQQAVFVCVFGAGCVLEGRWEAGGEYLVVLLLL